MIGDLLPYLNTAIWLAVFAYAVRIEHRLTRVEGLCRRVEELEAAALRRRAQYHPG